MLAVELLALLVTGVALVFVYRPTAAQAWDDIDRMDPAVTVGSSIRVAHRWLSHTTVITAVGTAALAAIAAIEARRARRTVLPASALIVALVLAGSFTGYLLPWDQLALWAVTVGTNMHGYLPMFGSEVRFVLIGGSEVAVSTLLRWFWTHVAVLPVLLLCSGVVLWRALRRPAGVAAEEGEQALLG